MITFERFLELFYKKAKIEPHVTLAQIRKQIRLNFTRLCHSGIINGTYIKRYRKYFEQLNVFYNIGNCTKGFPSQDENVCIFVENNPSIIISKKAKAYCKNSSVWLFENAKAYCINCDIDCLENSKVIAYKCSNIRISCNAKGLLKYCNDIVAEEDSTVRLCGNCIVHALNDAIITASDMCFIAAENRVKIIAREYTHIFAYEYVSIEADETCSIKRV